MSLTKLLACMALAFLIGTPAHSQSIRTPRALDNTTITSGVAIVAVAGPAFGCNIQSASNLIINMVGTAGTTQTGTNLLLTAGGVFQCGPFTSATSVSVNCSGGGSCAINGVRW